MRFYLFHSGRNDTFLGVKNAIKSNFAVSYLGISCFGNNVSVCFIGIDLRTMLEVESHVPRACTVTSRFVHK